MVVQIHFLFCHTATCFVSVELQSILRPKQSNSTDLIFFLNQYCWQYIFFLLSKKYKKERKNDKLAVGQMDKKSAKETLSKASL